MGGRLWMRKLKFRKGKREWQELSHYVRQMILHSLKDWLFFFTDSLVPRTFCTWHKKCAFSKYLLNDYTFNLLMRKLRLRKIVMYVSHTITKLRFKTGFSIFSSIIMSEIIWLLAEIWKSFYFGAIKVIVLNV